MLHSFREFYFSKIIFFRVVSTTQCRNYICFSYTYSYDHHYDLECIIFDLVFRKANHKTQDYSLKQYNRLSHSNLIPSNHVVLLFFNLFLTRSCITILCGGISHFFFIPVLATLMIVQLRPTVYLNEAAHCERDGCFSELYWVVKLGFFSIFFYWMDIEWSGIFVECH